MGKVGETHVHITALRVAIVCRDGGTPRPYRIEIKFLFHNILERYVFRLVLS
jgi:hypothetical protein